jgi:hypothetical protein
MEWKQFWRVSDEKRGIKMDVSKESNTAYLLFYQFRRQEI